MVLWIGNWGVSGGFRGLGMEFVVRDRVKGLSSTDYTIRKG